MTKSTRRSLAKSVKFSFLDDDEAIFESRIGFTREKLD